MSNLLTYNGYYGSVEYSSEDDCFFGKLIGINDLVTFEGQSTNELRTAFHEAVEDYLQMCKQQGKQPEKAYKGSFNVRIQPELHRQAAIMAAAEKISLNAFIEEAIRQKVKSPTTKLLPTA